MLALLLDELCHEAGPARLVARSNPGTVICVKIFKERDVITPVWIVLECFIPTKDSAASLLIAQKDPHHAMGNVIRNFIQRNLVARKCWAFHEEVIAVIMMKLLERFHDQVIDREPDRTPPIRIASEHARCRLAGRIRNAMLLTVGVQDKRAVAMELR